MRLTGIQWVGRLLSNLVCLLVAGSCLGQPHGTVLPSLEALVAGADEVFLGKVVKVTPIDSVTLPGGRDVLTVEVANVLKGSPGRRITLTEGPFDPASPFRRCSEQGIELMWFTADAARDRWAALDIRDATSRREPNGWIAALPILGLNLKPISQRSEALARITELLSMRHRATRMLSLGLTTSLVAKVNTEPAPSSLFEDMVHHTVRLFQDGVLQRVIVPVVPSLEPVGRWLITEAPKIQTAPNTIGLTPEARARSIRGLVTAQQMQCRLSGIVILAYFRSNENIDLVRSLLSDTGVMGYFKLGEIGESRHTEYPVRHAAYDLLVSWGVPVVRPVIELPDK